MTDKRAAAILAADAPPRPKGTIYPPPFAPRVDGRLKKALGDVFGLKNYGVNLTRLEPGSWSSLMHAHAVQDEFIYMLEGQVTLVTPDGETLLTAGMCAGFPAGGAAHHLINMSDAPATFLEVGDRLPGDAVAYPNDDLQAVMTPQGWRISHKDGTPY